LISVTFPGAVTFQVTMKPSPGVIGTVCKDYRRGFTPGDR